MAEPVLTVEVAWATNPRSTSPTWSDVSAYVRGVSINRGRENELDEVSAGTCVIRLDNRDGRFDPSSTTGPYGANLKPMRRVRVRAEWDSETYDLFDGFIERFEDSWPGGGLDAITTLMCADAFKVMSLETLPETEDYPAVVDRLLEPWGYWRLNTPPVTKIKPGARIKSGPRKGKRKRPKRIRTTVAQAGPDARVFGAPSFLQSATSGLDAISQDNNAGPVVGEMTYAMQFVGSSRVEAEAGGPDRPGDENAITVSCLLRRLNDTYDGVWVLRGPKTLPSGPTAWRITLPTVSSSIRIRFVVEHTDGTSTTVTGTTELEDTTQWVHVFATWRGDTGVGQLFVNGTREAVTTSGAKTMRRGTAATSNPIVIGQDDSGNSLNNYLISDVVVSETKWPNDADLPEAIELWSAARPRAGGSAGLGSPAFFAEAGQRALIIASVSVPDLKAFYFFHPVDGDGATTEVLPQRFDGTSKLDMLRRLEETEDGMLFVAKDRTLTFRGQSWRSGDGATIHAEFSDTPTGDELPYKDVEVSWGDEFIYTVVTVTREDGVAQTVYDDTATNTYLSRVLELTDTLHTTDAAALDRAETLLDRYKDKVVRVTSLSFNGLMDDDLYPQMLGRELFDRITVIRHTPGGNVIDADCRIHGIQLEINPSGAKWECRWALAPESF